MASYMLTVLVAVIFGSVTSDEILAQQDRQNFPTETHGYIYYITTASGHPTLPEGFPEQQQLNTAMRLVMPQMAPFQPVLERCLPVPVPGSDTLFRIDLRDLHWDIKNEAGEFVWHKVVEGYPYSESKIPLVLRADWLLIQLTDSQESSAYYQLVFGKRPKTRDEAFEIFGINTAKEVQRGLIAGESPVAVNKVRRIINFPSKLRGLAYLTEDSLEIAGEKDPLEVPDRSPVHDGEEGIIMIEKHMAKTGLTGNIMVFFLSNGQGEIVDRAPVDLVNDYTKLRGLTEIRNGSSCFSCHVNGYNPWKSNQFREYLEAGVEAYADYKTQEAVEAFHLIDLEKQLERANEDYALIIEAACGCSTLRAVQAYRQRLKQYDAEMTGKRAAQELGLTFEEFQLALAYAASQKYNLSGRVSGLAHNKKISRDSWEQQFLQVRKMVNQWRAGTNTLILNE